MRRLGAVLVLALAPAAARAGALAPPVLSLHSGALRLSQLPQVLSEATVARHLTTGLTTSLVFTVNVSPVSRDARAGVTHTQGGAQVRLRYELWEERYAVERWDGAPDSPARSTLPGGDLEGWWRSLTLVVVPRMAGLGAQARARVELLVLPFSEAEQRDAQDWLLRTFRPPDLPGRGDSSESVAGEALWTFYGAIVASSIGRRSLITYSWTVPIGTPPR